MYPNHTPVLIAGGGITGLSTALFLAHHGVSALLVERHPDLLIHPRARGFTPRTMELYRQVGLESAIHTHSYASGEGFDWVAIQADTVAGPDWVRATEPPEDDASSDASPSSFAAIDQDKLEILVRARAEESGADIRFSTELISFEQDDDGITAQLKDRRSGAESTVRARYLVGADGFSSPVRKQLGVGTDGPGPFFQTLTAMVDADLRPALGGRRLNIAYLQQPRPGTIIMAHDEAGLHWVFGTGYAPERGESLQDYPDGRIVELVRAAVGMPDLAVTLRPQIPGTDLKVLGFPIGAYVAAHYRVGRAFLVGDAAHIVPPTGGLGANTGIQDAHNLAWKLAAVLAGRAGDGLLDSYHAERHAVGLLTMQQALARWQARIGVGSTGNGAAALVDYGSLTFGYRYRSAAVLDAADGATVKPSELAGQPGTRAPHLELGVGGRASSTLDLFGKEWVLLAGEGANWSADTQAIARRLDVPLRAYRFGVDLDAPAVAQRYRIAADGAVLVRPDGFVAWRIQNGEPQPAAAFERALRRVLSR
jgi:putative polyketide hydroxylase